MPSACPSPGFQSTELQTQWQGKGREEKIKCPLRVLNEPDRNHATWEDVNHFSAEKLVSYAICAALPKRLWKTL